MGQSGKQVVTFADHKSLATAEVSFMNPIAPLSPLGIGNSPSALANNDPNRISEKGADFETILSVQMDEANIGQDQSVVEQPDDNHPAPVPAFVHSMIFLAPSAASIALRPSPPQEIEPPSPKPVSTAADAPQMPQANSIEASEPRSDLGLAKPPGLFMESEVERTKGRQDLSGNKVIDAFQGDGSSIADQIQSREGESSPTSTELLVPELGLFEPEQRALGAMAADARSLSVEPLDVQVDRTGNKGLDATLLRKSVTGPPTLSFAPSAAASDLGPSQSPATATARLAAAPTQVPVGFFPVLLEQGVTTSEETAQAFRRPQDEVIHNLWRSGSESPARQAENLAPLVGGPKNAGPIEIQQEELSKPNEIPTELRTEKAKESAAEKPVLSQADRQHSVTEPDISQVSARAPTLKASETAFLFRFQATLDGTLPEKPPSETDLQPRIQAQNQFTPASRPIAPVKHDHRAGTHLPAHSPNDVFGAMPAVSPTADLATLSTAKLEQTVAQSLSAGPSADLSEAPDFAFPAMIKPRDSANEDSIGPPPGAMQPEPRIEPNPIETKHRSKALTVEFDARVSEGIVSSTVASNAAGDRDILVAQPTLQPTSVQPSAQFGSLTEYEMSSTKSMPDAKTIIGHTTFGKANHAPGTHPIYQAAAALGQGPVEKPTQITLVLSPEKLGSVRFDMNPVGDGVQIVLSAERPETLDLMRRHAFELMAELKQAGYQSSTLSFGQWQHQGQGDASASVAPHLRKEPALEVPTLPPQPRKPSLNQGMDIRF